MSSFLGELSVLKRIGVYGGSFDPPHLAHEALAQAAIAQWNLDRLFVFPTGQAQHRASQATDAHHRLAMARLAFDEISQVVVDEREIRRLGATYTIDTLLELRTQYPAADLFLVMGEDQLRAFTGWHRWQEILQLATLIVAARAYSTPENDVFSSQKEGIIRPMPILMPRMQISATAIRSRVAAQLSLDTLVKPAVARYIATHHLYEKT